MFVSDIDPTTITKPLILEFIKTLSENTEKLNQTIDEVHKLREEVARLSSQKRALAVDVKCLSDGVKDFQDKFGPYLTEAVDNKKLWQGWKRDWFKTTVGTAIVCAGAFTAYVVGEVVITWVAQKLAARK